jgi:diacylglycerol O-acyltransferase/trehalose O-mycolyltransferase
MRFKGLLVALTLLFSGLVATPAIAGQDTATVISRQAITDRLIELQVHSDALHQDVGVRVLLPKDWARFPHRTWPTLYLLHGCCDGDTGYRSWTDKTDIAAFTANTNALIVMPEGGNVGFYSKWFDGSVDWEAFHLTELRRLLQHDFRADGRRAVAGLSMGGFGAFSYAARHPGFFQAAASYSGLVDTTYGGTLTTDAIQNFVTGGGFDKDALWGDPVAQADVWAKYNPYGQARRLRGIPVFLSAGNGEPGPFDAPGGSVDQLEQVLGAQAAEMTDRLHRFGVRVTADLYGPGTHSWPYWERELHKSFPMLMHSIGAIS